MTISRFELALITVEEHIVTDPGRAFTKSIVAPIINVKFNIGNFAKTVSSQPTLWNVFGQNS